jgi:hypothetical protein
MLFFDFKGQETGIRMLCQNPDHGIKVFFGTIKLGFLFWALIRFWLKFGDLEYESRLVFLEFWNMGEEF